MTTPSVEAIAEALAAALEAIPNVRVVPYLPDDPNPPCALVSIDTVDYHAAFGDGAMPHNFTIHLLATRASVRVAVAAIQGYMSNDGTNSVRAAIEADDTLGGVVSSVVVKRSGPPAPVSVGEAGVIYLSVPFMVEVHA